MEHFDNPLAAIGVVAVLVMHIDTTMYPAYREPNNTGDESDNEDNGVDLAALAIAEERREFYAKQTSNYLKRLPQPVGTPDPTIGVAHRERVKQRWFKATRTINIVHQTLQTLESFVLERGIGQLATVSQEIKARLVCFHTAGGHSLTFRQLAVELPKHGVDVRIVQLPGRMNRCNEVPFADVDEMVLSILHDFDRLELGDGINTVFLGHGMGALLAYLCAHKCIRKHKRFNLRHVIVVAAKTPAELTKRNNDPKNRKLHELPIRELIDVMVQFGGVPDKMHQRREVLQLLLPTFRADLTAMEAYQHQDIYGPLPCPITALGGKSDPMTNEAEVRAWQECTDSRPSVYLFPGSHYFFAQPENKHDFIQLVSNIMELAAQPETQRTARSTTQHTARSIGADPL